MHPGKHENSIFRFQKQRGKLNIIENETIRATSTNTPVASKNYKREMV